MGIKITNKSKKLLTNLLSLVKSNNKEIATSFYSEKQKFNK